MAGMPPTSLDMKSQSLTLSCCICTQTNEEKKDLTKICCKVIKVELIPAHKRHSKTQNLKCVPNDLYTCSQAGS